MCDEALEKRLRALEEKLAAIEFAVSTHSPVQRPTVLPGFPLGAVPLVGKICHSCNTVYHVLHNCSEYQARLAGELKAQVSRSAKEPKRDV